MWEVLYRIFGGGGGEGVCSSVLQILTLFQTKICNFLVPVSDLASFSRPLDSRWLFYFLLSYTVLTRAIQLETAVHGCRILLILGLVSIMSLSC